MSKTIRAGFGKNGREIATFQKPYVIERIEKGKIIRKWKEGKTNKKEKRG
jgi:hypothetical protein